jgi:hypothetical protein
MGHVRPFSQQDIPEVTSLHLKVFASRGRDQASLAALFDEIFFRNPWRDELASLVYEDQGKIIGFLGILPRRMFVKDRPIWAAVSTQFMVEPGSRGTLAAVHLLKALFSGPQELCITDGANSGSRKLWEALGGVTAYLYGIHWTRTLRPITYMMRMLGGKRSYLALLENASRPLCKGLDRLAGRWTPFRVSPESSAASKSELDIEQLLACIARFQAESPVRTEYDEASLVWILNLTIEKSPRREMRKVSLSDGAGTIGFYVYYIRPDCVAEVVQLNAGRNSMGEVLDDLFSDAWRRGAIAVSGRLAPCFIQELSDRHCAFKMGSPWMLIHSREPELLNTICRGDALLSRLDAEWWMPFAT